MRGNVVMEDGMAGNSANSQTDEDDLAKTENTQRGSGKSRKAS